MFYQSIATALMLFLISCFVVFANTDDNYSSTIKPESPAGSQPAESLKKPASGKSKTSSKSSARFPSFTRPDSYWRKKLSTGQYYVTRRKGTENAFTGIYWDHHDDGIYSCICCGTPLFDSESKFESGTGWPSYWQPINKNFIRNKPDVSGGVVRTEVNCRVCDAHLGHVFDDGPRPTGLRFCINSASIKFVPRKIVPEHIDKWRKDLGLPPVEPARREPASDSPVNQESKSAQPAEPNSGNNASDKFQ